MTPTELFKKLGGLYLADDYIAYKANTKQLDDFDFEFWQLKDSHELVEKVGGLDKAKEVFSEIGVGDYAERLKQAIADVESCQTEQDIEQWIDEVRACGESGWSKYDDPIGEWLKEDRGE